MHKFRIVSYRPLTMVVSLIRTVTMSLGWSLLEAECPAGEWMVERPLLNVLNRVTKEALFLKLFHFFQEKNQKLVFFWSMFSSLRWIPEEWSRIWRAANPRKLVQKLAANYVKLRFYLLVLRKLDYRYNYNCYKLQCLPFKWITDNRTSRLLQSNIAGYMLFINNTQNTSVNWIIWLLLLLLYLPKVIL